MILYHGSNTSFNAIDLGKGLPAKDFGCGFYMTDYTQYSFHTERALAALRFREVCDVA